MASMVGQMIVVRDSLIRAAIGSYLRTMNHTGRTERRAEEACVAWVALGTAFFHPKAAAGAGTYQPSAASQCESRKTMTSPWACCAPIVRARISPDRFGAITILTTGGIPAKYCVRSAWSQSAVEASFTRMISTSSAFGVRSSTDHTVRNSDDHISSAKQITWCDRFRPRRWIGSAVSKGGPGMRGAARGRGASMMVGVGLARGGGEAHLTTWLLQEPVPTEERGMPNARQKRQSASLDHTAFGRTCACAGA